MDNEKDFRENKNVSTFTRVANKLMKDNILWENNPEKFWDAIAEDNPYKGTWFPFEDKKKYFEIAEEQFKETEKLLTNCDMETALDLGVGAGRTLYPLVKKFKKVYGADISQKLLDVAIRNMKNFGYNVIPIKVINNKMVGIDNNSISFVNSITVFQHIYSDKDKQELRYEIFRILKPKGIGHIDELVKITNEQKLYNLYKICGFNSIKILRQNNASGSVWLIK